MHHLKAALIIFLVVIAIPTLIREEIPDIMTSADLPSLGNPPADVRIAYGEAPLQFVDLRLPAGPGPHPVMVLIHGGCWLSKFDITYIGKLATALAREGIATWNIEYRRVGDTGGGWPGTFQDIANAADYLLEVAEEYNLDTTRVIAAGHSAGGHLALWLAARDQLGVNNLSVSQKPLKLQGVLGLAPVPDLSLLHKKGVCDGVIDKLMGGTPDEYPERYAIGSATELVPLGLPQVVLVGAYDHAWNEMGRHYYQLALSSGDPVRLIDAADSGHFEMIDPDSSSWPLVRDAALELLNVKKYKGSN